jgi:hypothetical protein
MSERLRTLLYALVALAMLASMMFAAPAPDDGYRALSTETNVSGLAVLYRWFEANDVDVRVLDGPWSGLPGGTGHVLLAHSPERRSAERRERDALHEWVRSGNRLVVADFGNEEFAPSRMSSLAVLGITAPGLSLEDVAGADPIFPSLEGPDSPFAGVPRWARALGGLEVRELVPAGAHPLTAGVGRLEVIGDLHGHRWRQRFADGRHPWLPLLVDARSGGEVAWTRGFGAGEIVVTLHPSMFSSGALDRADNALLARVLLTPGPEAALLVDDHHQTAALFGAGERLLADGRFHATVLTLLLVWLLWLLADDGAFERRVRPPTLPLRRRADLVRAVGGFLSRHVDRAAAAERLMEPLRLRLAQRHGVPPEQALERLEDEPAVDAAQRRAWYEMTDRIRRGRRVPLRKVRIMTLDMLERLA